MSSNTEATPAAREVREAYRACLEARRQYRRSIGSGMESRAHELLHEAVFDLYEVLRPTLKTANATEELWKEEPLWPVARATTEASICPECDRIAPIKYASNGSLCPECEMAVMEKGTAPAVDENGEAIYEWAEGLRTLDGLRNRTRTIPVEYQDALGTHKTERTERVLLPPERLMAAADALDEALEKLDLLVNIDDDLPTGKVTGVANE